MHINKDEAYAVIAQCYSAKTAKRSAPSNKASDLNTAVSWLLQRPIDELPARLRSAARELRSSLIDGSVSTIHVWYVHNLPESQNVADELLTVEQTLGAALKNHFPGMKTNTYVVEVGAEQLEEWYLDTQSPILVTEKFRVPMTDGFEVKSDRWQAFVTTLPAKFLHKNYRKYRTKLFSANVRDYLGSRKSDANINNGIKRSAQDRPDDFWVFNNGLTILVLDYSTVKVRGRQYLKIKGMSVVNGAQTTGAIGSLAKSPKASAKVPVRFVKTSDHETVLDIIQFNNSQNKVTASDFRSRDRIQRRLREEFESIPNADYQGGRRGGYEDLIRRNTGLLPSYTVGQALAAMQQDPEVAYNQKSKIWASDSLYARYFTDDTSARHIILVYSLLRAVEGRKLKLVTKSKKADSLTELETRELEFFRYRGASYLLVSAVAACLESILGKQIPKMSRLSFGSTCSPREAEKNWAPILDVVVSFCPQLEEAFSDGLKSKDRIKKALGTFQSLIQATATANASIFNAFAKKVKTQAKRA